jgi:hypothetical protein
MEGREMKKLVLSIVFAIMMSFTVSAQSDWYVAEWDGGIDRIEVNPPDNPFLYYAIGILNGDYDPEAPLGSGLLIFTAMGAGYVLLKKKNINKK